MPLFDEETCCGQGPGHHLAKLMLNCFPVGPENVDIFFFYLFSHYMVWENLIQSSGGHVFGQSF